MHNYFRFFSLVFILCITACANFSFFPNFFAPYEIGVSYYHNGQYRVQSIIHPEYWEQQENNVWMCKLHLFHIEASLSERTNFIKYDQDGIASEYDYFELPINPDNRRSFPSGLIIFAHGSINNPGQLLFSQTHKGSLGFVHLSKNHFTLPNAFVNKMKIGHEIIDSSGVKCPVIHLFLTPKRSPDLYSLYDKEPQTLKPEIGFTQPKDKKEIFEDVITPDSKNTNITPPTPQPLIPHEKPPYNLGVRSAFDYAHIAGSISTKEWKKYINYFEARLFSLTISLSQEKNNGKKITKNGFSYKPSNKLIDTFVVDLHQKQTNTVPLIVRVYGFSQYPPSLKFSQVLKGQSSFFELKKNNFIINHRTAEKLEVGNIIISKGVRYPLVNLYYEPVNVDRSVKHGIKNEVTVTTIIEDYELILSSIKEIAYLEYMLNDVIVATSPVNKKEISYIFTVDKVPTSVQLSTRQKKIQAKYIGYQKYILPLQHVTKKVSVKNHLNQPIDQAVVHIYANRKRPVQLKTKSTYSVFSYISRFFSKPKVSYITEKITVYSGKTNMDGIAAFVDLNDTEQHMSADISKPGFVMKENIPASFPLQVRLEGGSKTLETIALQYDTCMNESLKIHQSGGRLEIYENGHLFASLPPEDLILLPFAMNPVYKFKHPDYIYHDIAIDSYDKMKIIPKAKIQRVQGKVQILIIMDVTDDDPRGVALLKALKAVVRYLKNIEWDNLTTDNKHRIKVASAYQDHLNYFSHTEDIDQNILMVQADCSLTDQLKKAFVQFDTSIPGKKQVIYLISSRRATVVVDDYLVNHFNTNKLIQNQNSFNAIVVGEYGGNGMRKLSKTTRGFFSYCKTSEEIYKKLNDIVGPLTSEPQFILCSKHQ